MIATIFNKFIFFLVGLLFAANSASQHPYTWRVDFSSFEGPIARVDIPFGLNSRSYMVIFEYKRKCEPLFASLTTKISSSRLGRVIQRRAVNPAVYFLTINGVRHTWHGAVTDYQNASEVAIGLTQQAWDSLLSGPSNIFFIEGDAGIYNVPLLGIDSAIKSASQVCLSKI